MFISFCFIFWLISQKLREKRKRISSAFFSSLAILVAIVSFLDIWIDFQKSNAESIFFLLFASSILFALALLLIILVRRKNEKKS